MEWKVEFQPSAERDLDKISSENARSILGFLHGRVARLEDPRSIGEALSGSRIGSLWKYRVGDYRVLAEIEDRTIRIIVIRIGHRREIYRR